MGDVFKKSKCSLHRCSLIVDESLFGWPGKFHGFVVIRVNVYTNLRFRRLSFTVLQLKLRIEISVKKRYLLDLMKLK